MTSSRKFTFAVLVAFLIVGCTPPCEVTLLKEMNSPGATYTVAVYTRDCGATTSTSTTVNIRARAKKFADRVDAGNVFIVTHAKDVDVNWASDHELSVSVRGDPEIYLQTVKLGSLVITYLKD